MHRVQSIGSPVSHLALLVRPLAHELSVSNLILPPRNIGIPINKCGYLSSGIHFCAGDRTSKREKQKSLAMVMFGNGLTASYVSSRALLPA
jgi:hypothetical protein